MSTKANSKDRSRVLIALTLDSIGGRTVLLSGLMVNTKPPYDDTATNLTSIIMQAGHHV